jgi:hypothetical protein
MDSLQRDLADLAAALRSEIRLEAEEAEREAAAAAALQRSLADVARELMAHGDIVAVDAGGRVFVGSIAEVGTDLVGLEASAGRVVVNLGCVASLRVVQRARAGGRSPVPGVQTSFRARLLELCLSGEEVEAGMSGIEDSVVGRLAFLGSDHAAIGDAGGEPEWFLPLAYLAFVRTRGPGAAWSP